MLKKSDSSEDFVEDRVKKVIRIGSRDSRLAVVQAELVMEQIKKEYPNLTLELVTMKTTGDKILDRRLDQIGGKGLFVKELDQALLEGKIDISVHSLKDLPMEIPEELPLVAFSRREDPRDAMVVKTGHTGIKQAGITGTSSKRRMIQLRKLYPQMRFKNIRGNLQTRFRKLAEDDFDQIVLAAAGLKRMDMAEKIYYAFSPEEMIPSAGQGILAVQARAGEDISFLDCVQNRESAAAALAERSFVRTLDGGCSSPIAAYAQAEGTELKLLGLYASEDAEEFVTGSITGAVEAAEALGEKLAKELLYKVL